MNILSFLLWLGAFASVFSSKSFALTFQDSPTEVLRKLQTYDKVYSTALSAIGTVHHSPSPRAPLNPTVPKTWRYSVTNRRIALVESSTDQAVTSVVKYHPLKDNTNDFLTYDEDGNMFVSVDTSGAWSFENDRSASFRGVTLIKVSPAGKVLMTKKDQAFDYYGPEDSTLSLPVRVVNWILGRGYSPYLQEIASVQISVDGTLDVVAVGSFGSTSEGGKWELNVDQNSQYLVRSAKFFEKDKTHAFVIVSNQSINRDGICFYPLKGDFELFLYNGAASLRTNITVDKTWFEADESIFIAARELTNDASAPGSLITDFRFQPPKLSVVSEIVSNPPIKRKWSFILSVSIGLVVLGIVAGVLGYRRRKR